MASTCELLIKEEMRGGIALGSWSKKRGGEAEKEGKHGPRVSLRNKTQSQARLEHHTSNHCGPRLMVISRGGMVSLSCTVPRCPCFYTKTLAGLVCFLIYEADPYSHLLLPSRLQTHLSQDPLAKLDWHKSSNTDLSELGQIP